MPKRVLFVLLPFLFGCGGSPASPSSQPIAPTAPPLRTLTGRIIDTVTSQPVAANIEVVGIGSALSDASGMFNLTTTNMAGSSRVTVAAAGYLTREVVVSWPDPTIDVIPDVAPFSLSFYRQFVRNGHEQPNTLQPLRRWTRPPMIYLKTVDEAGEPIPSAQLDSTEATIIHSAHAFTGNRFGVAGVERGTETRLGQQGWVTIVWLAADEGEYCGLATVGTEGSRIALNYRRGRGCSCGSLAIRPRTVKHELGHAMGFWHTDSTGDLMSATGVSGCDADLSARERFHAGIAFNRELGNTDVDNAPRTTTFTLRQTVIVD